MATVYFVGDQEFYIHSGQSLKNDIFAIFDNVVKLLFYAKKVYPIKGTHVYPIMQTHIWFLL